MPKNRRIRIEGEEDIHCRRYLGLAFRRKSLLLFTIFFSLFGGAVGLMSGLKSMYGTAWGPIVLGVAMVVCGILMAALYEAVVDHRRSVTKSSVGGFGIDFSHCMLLRAYDYEVRANGEYACVVTERFRVLSEVMEIKQGISSLYAGSTFDEYRATVELKDGPPGTRISKVDRLTSRQRLLMRVRFVPPLKRDQEAEVVRRFSNRGIHMERDSILNYIERGEWVWDEPIEGRELIVRAPTKQLVCRLAFPRGYPIEDAFYDVYLVSAKERDTKEYDRLAIESCFQHTETQGAHTLMLRVDEARIGLTYAIMWKPARRDAYERFLGQLQWERN